MPTFQYKAIDNKTGMTVKNTVKAENKQELYTRLKNNGLTPISVEPAFQFTIQPKDDEDTIEQKIRKEIKSGITQIIGMLILLVIGTLSIIPTIQMLFNNMSSKLQLPWITRKINDISGFLYGFVIILVIVVIIAIIYFKTKNGKKKWQTIKYQIPILGKIAYEIEALKLKDSSEVDIEKEIGTINRKISKITHILLGFIIIFFAVTVLIPAIQIYIQALTI